MTERCCVWKCLQNLCWESYSWERGELVDNGQRDGARLISLQNGWTEKSPSFLWETCWMVIDADCWSQFVIFEHQPRCWFADQPVDGNQGVDEGWTLKICRNPGLDHLVVHQISDASIILIPATTVPQCGLSHSKLILNPKPPQQFQFLLI